MIGKPRSSNLAGVESVLLSPSLFSKLNVSYAECNKRDKGLANFQGPQEYLHSQKALLWREKIDRHRCKVLISGFRIKHNVIYRPS